MTSGYKHFEKASDYTFGCPVGAWTAILGHKAWGRSRNMILYFTDAETSARYQFSVFASNGYQPRDNSFSFKDAGNPGDRFALVTSHNGKGAPVLQSARR